MQLDIRQDREPQVLNSTSPPFIPQTLPATTETLHMHNTTFTPQVQMTHPQTFMPPLQDLPITTPIPTTQNSSDLVNALAEAISTNRLPIPEPTVFTGDPLKFKDW